MKFTYYKIIFGVGGEYDENKIYFGE